MMLGDYIRSIREQFYLHRTTRLVWLKMEFYTDEVYLTIASFWASYVLFTPPPNFATYPQSFAFVESIQGHEITWATLALAGATLKITGLAIRLKMSRPTTLSLALRTIGLGISGFFWTLMGISSLWGNPDSLFGIWGALMGIAAWRVLVRFLLEPGAQ